MDVMDVDSVYIGWLFIDRAYAASRRKQMLEVKTIYFFRSYLLHKFNSPNRQKYIETHNVTSTAWAPRFDRNVQEVKNIG